MHAIGRLEAVLAKETDALKAGTKIDLNEVNGRKNQSLLELSRISRSMKPDAITPELRARLQTLKARLEANQLVLKRHVDASEEIAGVIARAIERAESDGTYDAPASGIRRLK